MQKDEDHIRRANLQNQNRKKAHNMDTGSKPNSLNSRTRGSSKYESEHGPLTQSERYRVNLNKQNLKHEVQPDEPMKVTIIK